MTQQQKDAAVWAATVDSRLEELDERIARFETGAAYEREEINSPVNASEKDFAHLLHQVWVRAHTVLELQASHSPSGEGPYDARRYKWALEEIMRLSEKAKTWRSMQ